MEKILDKFSEIITKVFEICIKPVDCFSKFKDNHVKNIFLKFILTIIEFALIMVCSLPLTLIVAVICLIPFVIIYYICRENIVTASYIYLILIFGSMALFYMYFNGDFTKTKQIKEVQ